MMIFVYPYHRLQDSLCHTTFNCSEACPRGIEVTKAIAEVKQAVLRGRR